MSFETNDLELANQVVELTNLSPGACHRATVVGRVVKREFDARGTVLTGVVVESAAGDRSFINIDQSALGAPQVSMVAREWIQTGLRTMLIEGRDVSLGIKLCGAAGRVAMLDAVTLVAGTTPPSRSANAVGPSFDCGGKAVATPP